MAERGGGADRRTFLKNLLPGGAGVEMRYSGESEKDAKERRKAEKRARRKRLKG